MDYNHFDPKISQKSADLIFLANSLYYPSIGIFHHYVLEHFQEKSAPKDAKNR